MVDESKKTVLYPTIGSLNVQTKKGLILINHLFVFFSNSHEAKLVYRNQEGCVGI